MYFYSFSEQNHTFCMPMTQNDKKMPQTILKLSKNEQKNLKNT